MIVPLAPKRLLLINNIKLTIENVVNPSFDKINVYSALNFDDFGVAVA